MKEYVMVDKSQEDKEDRGCGFCCLSFTVMCITFMILVFILIFKGCSL
jgi:hypothetical protein